MPRCLPFQALRLAGDSRGLQAQPMLALVIPVGHVVHYLHCADADRAHPLQQVYYLLLVVGEAVCVELLCDGGIPGLLLLVLVQDPLKSRPAAQAGNARRPAALRSGWSCHPAAMVPLLLVWPQAHLLCSVAACRFSEEGRDRRTRSRRAGQEAPVQSAPTRRSRGRGAGEGAPAVRSIAYLWRYTGSWSSGVGVGKDVLGGDAAVRIYGVKVLAPLFPVVLVDAPDAPLRDVADPLPIPRVAVEG